MFVLKEVFTMLGKGLKETLEAQPQVGDMQYNRKDIM